MCMVHAHDVTKNQRRRHRNLQKRIPGNHERGATGHNRQYYIPLELCYWASNNIFKHLTSIIMPWIDIIDVDLGEGDCVLSVTDSSTSKGWTRKTNFQEINHDDSEEASVRREVARKHAKQFLELKVKDYRQFYLRLNNIISNLSRDDNRSNKEFATILNSCASLQVPEHFKIQLVIVYWLTLLLQRLPMKEKL